MGIDISNKQIEHAKDLAKQNNVDVVFIKQDMDDLSCFENQKFDLIVSSHAIGYAEDFDKVMSECNRILRKDGRIVACFGHPVWQVIGEAMAREDFSKITSYFKKDRLVWDWPGADNKPIATFEDSILTISTIMNGMIAAGFKIMRVVEPHTYTKQEIQRLHPDAIPYIDYEPLNEGFIATGQLLPSAIIVSAINNSITSLNTTVPFVIQRKYIQRIQGKMERSRGTMRIRFFSIVLILSLLVNPLIVAMNSDVGTQLSVKTHSQKIEQSSRDDGYPASILFNPDNQICRSAAEKLYHELSPTSLIINLIPIKSEEMLTQNMIDSKMNIYVFHGTENGMEVGSEIISWLTLSTIIDQTGPEHNIFQVCHSNLLEDMLPDKSIHTLKGSIDTEIAILGALCAIYDIFDLSTDSKEEALASEIFDITSIYLLSNLNTIIQRTMNPQNTLDGFYIDYGQDETDARGPWGWIIDVFMYILLVTGYTNGDWYDSNSTHVNFDKDRINSGSTGTGSMTMEKMGGGDKDTGEFPFEIPIDFDVTPRIGTGPWYMPDYVDLVFTVQAEDGALDLAKVLGLKQVFKAAGYDVSLELTPKLSATLRIGNFIQQIADANPTVAENPFKFMGGSFSIELGFELGIPLATFLDYLIPGTGKTVSTIMDVLNMKVNLVNYLSLALGMNYNATTEASKQDVTLKVGFGLDIALSLPSPASYIKEAIGVSLPLDFIKLGLQLKAKTGILAQASFGHEGDSFKVGLFYNLFFKFYASLFWIFKFDVTKSWKGTVPFLSIQSKNSNTNPPTDEHANLDLDGDGLWDELEKSMGLDPTQVDTDGDHLSDGNELLNYFTDPLLSDTDADGLSDSEELALFYAAGLDPLADYDNDGKPSIMDYDSDDDGLNDKQELKGMSSVYWLEVIKTNPSVKDSDYDGFTDSEEWAFAGHDLEDAHPHPLKKDSDQDGLWDKFEYDWYQNEYGVPSPVLYILNSDVDGEGLNDGEEFDYGTSPLDIDTDNDFDLNNDNIINSTEQNLAINDGNYGSFTDYGEIQGNTWQAWNFGLDDCVPPNPTPTNPLKKDSDNDGVSDVAEYTANTLPVSEDSDADGIENVQDFFFFHANCTDPDTDNDYLRDGTEVQYYNLIRGISNESIANLHYLNNSDVDEDGVLDGLELRIGTDPLNNDTDSDGLLDGEELEIGSYPLVNDTDEDSLLDGVEVHYYNTDPLRKDTDNDGLPDPIEVVEGSLYILYRGNVTYFTNPNDPDSDDDGITDGEEYYGWNWAVDRKVAPGSNDIDEPIIEEDDEYILDELFGAPDPYRARFQTHPADPDTDMDGLSDGLEKEIVLSPLTNDTDADNWIDVDEIDYMMKRFPSTWESYDIWHYLDFDRDGVSDFVEMQEGTDMLMPDTDMDGLDDWTELFVPSSVSNESTGSIGTREGVTVTANTTLPENRRYTLATKADTDEDGLNDYWELMNGTDPLNPDSDFDDLTDYEELVTYQTYEGSIKVSLDPLNNDTDADGIIDGVEVQYCEERMSESGNSEHGPMGDFDNDGIINILDYDSDDDGIYDGFEVFEYHDPSLSWHPIGTDMFDGDQNNDMWVDGIDTDFDNDSLSDYHELTMIIPGYTYTTLGDENTTFRHYSHLINHTLCVLEDTDSDGYNDGWEINFGSDPLNPNSFPQIFSWQIPDFGYNIGFQTSSNIQNQTFSTEDGTLEFDISGPEGTIGFCNVTIPHGLLYAAQNEWIVLFDGDPISYVAEPNETATMISFSYQHSEHHVVIQGTDVLSPPSGFDPIQLLLIGSIVGVVIIVVLVFLLKQRKQS